MSYWSSDVCTSELFVGWEEQELAAEAAPTRAKGAGSCAPYGPSALDDVHRQAAARGFLVLVLHVAAGVAHGLDDLVQAALVLAVAAQGPARCVDRLHRAHRVAFDARDLPPAPARGTGG